MKTIQDSIAESMHRMKSIPYWRLISGLTPAEVHLLATICGENCEGTKVSDLYESCGMQPAAVSRLMNSLEEKGLIVRSTRKGNRRVIDVEATELGRQTDAENRSVLQGYWDAVLADVPGKDVETMLHILAEIMDSMERVLAEKLNDREKENH